MYVGGHVYIRGGRVSIYPLKRFPFSWVIISKVSFNRIPSESKARRDKKKKKEKVNDLSQVAVTLCCYVVDGKLDFLYGRQ